MRRLFELLGELSLVGLGVVGLVDVAPIPAVAAVALISLGGVLIALALFYLFLLRGPWEFEQEAQGF